MTRKSAVADRFTEFTASTAAADYDITSRHRIFAELAVSAEIETIGICQHHPTDHHLFRRWCGSPAFCKR